jgi:hypothetical protein
LSAVFIPTAFIQGITGKFYQQFALTIAVSTLISAFNSLTLSPALAALLLQPHHAPKDLVGRLLHGSVGWLFAGFNRLFDLSRSGVSGTDPNLRCRPRISLPAAASSRVMPWPIPPPAPPVIMAAFRAVCCAGAFDLEMPRIRQDARYVQGAALDIERRILVRDGDQPDIAGVAVDQGDCVGACAPKERVVIAARRAPGRENIR